MPFTLENDRIFVIYSDDHGATWSERREITAGNKRDAWGWYATGPVHSIQIQRGPQKGRLVIPVDVGSYAAMTRVVRGPDGLVQTRHGAFQFVPLV